MPPKLFAFYFKVLIVKVPYMTPTYKSMLIGFFYILIFLQPFIRYKISRNLKTLMSLVKKDLKFYR